MPSLAIKRWSKIKAYAKAIKFANVLKPQTFDINVHISDDIMTFMNNIDTLEWNVFDLQELTGGRALYYTALYLINRHNLINKLNLNSTKLMEFLNAIEKGYKPNPYHNSTHGCDVMQTVHHMLLKGTGFQYLSDIDLLAAIIASACHDYAHPGVSNLFERLTESERAVRFNDQSILENFHCSETFMLLYLPQYNFMDNVPKEDKRQFRDLVISMILATDIGRHFALLDHLRKGIAKAFDGRDRENVVDMLRMIIKCADVGNPAKPRDISEKWSHMVQEEFFAQGDMEK
ncbi:hypothetical protein AKO1_009465 [Acrasis kona]|uniref:PDEase domain-containing protein n=1 Tax=Acrasis kona TaxID=1008807 RepID=A0AAW2ZMY4_9EUKA